MATKEKYFKVVQRITEGKITLVIRAEDAEQAEDRARVWARYKFGEHSAGPEIPEWLGIGVIEEPMVEVISIAETTKPNLKQRAAIKD